MKKIIILAFDFPPYNSIGAQRPYGWFKYFKDYGFYPIVFTRHWNENILNEVDYIKPSLNKSAEYDISNSGTIVRLPYNPNLRDKLLIKYGFSKYNSFRKLLTFYYSFARFITFKADNTSNIFYEANKYISNNKCDYIIASGEPFILFRYASILSKKHKIPWIADYRDGWSTNLSSKYFSRLKVFLNTKLNGYFENRYIANSEFLITVSDFAKNELSKIHQNKIIHLISNGYFLEEYENLFDVKQDKEKFIISYAGSLYPFQPVELFLESIKDFIETENVQNIEIVFYGLKFYEEQEKRVLNYDLALNKYIKTTHRLPKINLFSKLKKSHVLLLLASDTVDGSCAKIYDYLPLNRKILLAKNDNGILEKIIDNCNAGYKCSTKEEIINAIKVMYNDFIERGEVLQQTTNIENYSRKYQTSLLADLILNR